MTPASVQQLKPIKPELSSSLTLPLDSLCGCQAYYPWSGHGSFKKNRNWLGQVYFNCLLPEQQSESKRMSEACYLNKVADRCCVSYRLQVQLRQHGEHGEKDPDLPSHRGGLSFCLCKEDLTRRPKVSQNHRCKVMVSAQNKQ